MKASFVAREQLTETIAQFSFATEKPFQFTAGQYINVTLSGHVEDGQPAERWFTISSSPQDELITITTRLSSSAFKRALQNLQTGASVDISEPMGAFVLPKLLQTPIVFVAGGIGVTPFHSMLRWLHQTGESRPISMIYSVEREDDIVFQDTFDAANQHVTLVVDEPSDAWGGLRGPLSAEMILGLEQPLGDNGLIYISGPEPYVQHLQHSLKQAGVKSQQIVTDEFQGYEQL